MQPCQIRTLLILQYLTRDTIIKCTLFSGQPGSKIYIYTSCIIIWTSRNNATSGNAALVVIAIADLTLYSVPADSNNACTFVNGLINLCLEFCDIHLCSRKPCEPCE